jgi:uncharacterized protein
MPKKKLLGTAIAVYATMAGIAVLWSLISGHPIFWIGERPAISSVIGWMILGAIGGVAIVFLSRIYLDRFTWAQSLSDWFADILGPITWKDALVLALLSGFAEEMLFRGALQPTLGLIPTTIIFGLCHWPPRKELRPWTILTMVLGFFFGVATLASGHLTAAIVAHFMINFINLTAIGNSSRT